jgi:hypothetical protein
VGELHTPVALSSDVYDATPPIDAQYHVAFVS